jgi:hypothetical protein
MSKIQAFFSADGRRLFESEKPAVEAFNHKYARALASTVLPQGADVRERASAVPPQGTNVRAVAGAVLTQRGMAGVVVTTRRLIGDQIVSDKNVRAPQSVSAKARTIKRQSIVPMLTKKLGSQKSK